ncbi:hypothetical protein JXL83_01295 [candidate division WOR-3 bacterium]|nr:hypothetical protein [candidate division WOR-3 bacterium]
MHPDERIYLSGIAGSGMFTLAAYLSSKKYLLTGSDRLFDSGRAQIRKKCLAGLGIDIVREDSDAISECSILVRSPAVENSTPVIRKATALKLPVYLRSEILVSLIKTGNSICVAGTSGKTTTAVIIGHIFRHAGRKPAVLTGNEGSPPDFKDTENFFIVEADESDGTLPLYRPDTGLLLNISSDHFDTDKLRKHFTDFCLNSKKCLVHTSCASSICCGTVYSTENRILSRQKESQGTIWTEFVSNDEVYRIPLFGDHNIENCMSAKTAALENGIDLSVIKSALECIPVIKRRLEYKGKNGGTCIYDDFAHNPAKIKASLKALKEIHENLFVVFKPHGFGPLKNFGFEIAKSFSDSLGKCDRLHILEVFYSGGTVTERLWDSKFLEKTVKSLNKEVAVTEGNINLKRLDFSSFGALVTMGARDPELGELTDEIAEKKPGQL